MGSGGSHRRSLSIKKKNKHLQRKCQWFWRLSRNVLVVGRGYNATPRVCLCVCVHQSRGTDRATDAESERRSGQEKPGVTQSEISSSPLSKGRVGLRVTVEGRVFTCRGRAKKSISETRAAGPLMLAKAADSCCFACFKRRREKEAWRWATRHRQVLFWLHDL